MRTTSGQIRDAETKTITFENDGLIRTFIKVSSLFWFGSKRIRAWSLSIGFCTCLFACMIASVVANQWNKFFFDALQQQNAYALRIAIIYIVFLCILTSLFSLALLQLRMHLQLQWRIWLTEFLVTGWLRTLGHQLTNASRCVDNPEARIGDDARLSVELAVDLTGGIINTILLSTSFIFVLWHVGGTLHFANVSIPGYLVFVVIIYSSLTSFGMYCLAMPLVEKVEEKASAEGDFRFELASARSFPLQPLCPQPDASKGSILRMSFSVLASKWVAVIGQQTRMIALTSANGVLAPVIPLLLGAPKFLSGEMTLGDLMQSSAAFWQVHLALNWLADNALSLANWSASARRVSVLYLACKNSDGDFQMSQDEPVDQIS